MAKRFYVYILASRSRNLYTGMTNNLKRRVREHREDLASSFTKRYRIDRLVYFESHTDVRNAILREKRIKAWTRAKRVTLIEQNNPAWDDLSAAWFDNLKRRKAGPSLRSG